MSAQPEFESDVIYQARPEDVDVVTPPDERAATDAARFESARERELLRLRNDLLAVIAKLGVSISIPDRPFTIEEWQTIRHLRSVLDTASIIQTWDTVTFPLPSGQARSLVEEYGERYMSLGVEITDSVPLELFGTSLPLGPVRMLFKQARLAGLEVVGRQLEKADLLRLPILVRFVPGEDKSMEIRYPEWGPNPTSSGPERRLDAAERLILLPATKSRRLHLLFAAREERPLTIQESRELTTLVREHARLLRERTISLYGARAGLELDEARRRFEAEFAEGAARWSALLADPEQLDALVAQAREPQSSSDG